MNTRKSAAILSAVAALLGGGLFRSNAQNGVTFLPLKSVPTFSTANIGRQGHFYVGGKWVGELGKETMDGAMYVEVWVPKEIRHPYPVVFVTGGGGQGPYSLMQTPDGRPGWAYDFVNQGYTVYMMDYPGTGRSAYIPGVDGTITPPRSGPLMEEVWSGGRPPSTPQSSWPQAKKYSQWPSNAPNKGKMGDPVFDDFAKTQVQFLQGGSQDKLNLDAHIALLEKIGTPVILITHSQGGLFGFQVADARPKLVKAILTAEPAGPPIQNVDTAKQVDTGKGNLVWGVTSLPVKYDPPINDVADLQVELEAKSDGPGLVPCWLQKEPAHKLVNMVGIRVLDVSAEASYHRVFDSCDAKWLNQAGVKTDYVKLEDVGLPGNAHEMMLEKNSDGIAAFFAGWIEKNVR